MCVVLLSTSVPAQNKETKLTLTIRNATLESFVRQLENATGFSFVYGEDIKVYRRITVEAKGLTIAEILDRAFANEPVGYEISGKHILLHKRPMPERVKRRRFTISGYLTDKASAETLIGANIVEESLATGTTTNPYGFYSLTLPEGEVNLCFSYLGYEPGYHCFVLEGDTLLNIALESHNCLDEVVVLSNKRDAGIQSTALGAHEIPMAQIQHTPAVLGEADVLKTIQLMPGVQAGVEGFSGLYVRGGGADQNLVMLDGIPVYTAIGHERDSHVADMVAHCAVKTPTALADVFIDALAAEDENAPRPEARAASLSDEERKIFDYLAANGEKTIDNISVAVKMSAADILKNITLMSAKGLVYMPSAGRYGVKGNL